MTPAPQLTPHHQLEQDRARERQKAEDLAPPATTFSKDIH
jgi:hypothetical protein